MKDFFIKVWDKLHLYPFIVTAYIEPTNYCNLRCLTCYSKDRPKGYMDMNLFYKIKDQIYRIPTISNITLNFAGEPTLHPKHLEMVEAFNTKNALGRQYKTRFFTNGSNPLTKYVDKVDYISVSLDGIGQVHERMRPGSSWNNVKKN
ncbi:MAG: radical SAM protein, partial [Bacilli bacterium]